MNRPTFLDEPPVSDKLTDYDRAHFKLYMRLLHAEADGSNWEEAVAILFGIDPSAEPERALRIHDAHLARARWTSEHFYREMVRQSHH
ncbi:DUF2285 domain-containing protein [Chelativorans sp. ZYF759]|uniref:DUF2285 domain-containing protein n=1 Tax=Chelativorans sp. ZYF759 TaxID=2692213 RepID=UPI0012ED5485|nr:DUF2285 domain-containing protein [Chelativorans sp. ZYF759]NMG38368.1 DUF2285 domain-containing protein [Chelativorans sp. ZYF759]